MFPLLATKLNDWVPTPHTEGRNAVEYSERSAELCGWAVVDNENERGTIDIDVAVMQHCPDVRPRFSHILYLVIRQIEAKQFSLAKDSLPMHTVSVIRP